MYLPLYCLVLSLLDLPLLLLLMLVRSLSQLLLPLLYFNYFKTSAIASIIALQPHLFTNQAITGAGLPPPP